MGRRIVGFAIGAVGGTLYLVASLCGIMFFASMASLPLLAQTNQRWWIDTGRFLALAAMAPGGVLLLASATIACAGAFGGWQLLTREVASRFIAGIGVGLLLFVSGVIVWGYLG